MRPRVERIEALLREAFAPSVLEVVDDSAAHRGHAGAASGAGHFDVRVVSPAFAGKTPIQRHRLVYQALAGMMHTEIHALSIKAYTPEEC